MKLKLNLVSQRLLYIVIYCSITHTPFSLEIVILKLSAVCYRSLSNIILSFIVLDFRHVVLDEADRMLEMGFQEKVDEILKNAYTGGITPFPYLTKR